MTLVPLSPKYIYEDRLKLKIKSEIKGSENTNLVVSHERREKSNSTKRKKWRVSKKWREKQRSEKNRIEKSDEGKTRKHTGFYAKESEIKSGFYTNQPMFILLYKETYFNANELNPFILSVVVSLLQEFDDVFPEDVPNGLPSLKEMQYQVDIIHGVVIHN